MARKPDVANYFPRKDELIVDVYEETVSLLQNMACEALSELTVETRVARLVGLHAALRTRIRKGGKGLITALSEIRSLDQEHKDALLVDYRGVVDTVRAFSANLRTSAAAGGALRRSRRRHPDLSLGAFRRHGGPQRLTRRPCDQRLSSLRAKRCGSGRKRCCRSSPRARGRA